MTIRVVHVEYEQVGNGQWTAESLELPEWLAVGTTLDEIRRLAREGLRYFLAEDVVVVDAYTPGPSATVDPMFIHVAFDGVYASNKPGPRHRPRRVVRNNLPELV